MPKFHTANAELFCRAECIVGEGPFWYAGRLYWVDIFGRKLHSCDNHGRDHQTISVPCDVGSAAPWANGFIAATKDGIGRLSRDGALTLLPASPPLSNDFRFNDGKLDPQGRFWCGSTTYALKEPVGQLYRVDQNGTVSNVLGGLTLANGLDWDKDAGLFYFIDTMTHRVDVFDYDAIPGDISNRRTAFEVPKDFGIPDGMTRDSSGRLWVACWGGSHVVAFDPYTGRPVAEVRVPTQLTSSCSIGPDHRTLYITTARLNLSAETFANEPLAGSVFRAELPK